MQKSQRAVVTAPLMDLFVDFSARPVTPTSLGVAAEAGAGPANSMDTDRAEVANGATSRWLHENMTLSLFSGRLLSEPGWSDISKSERDRAVRHRLFTVI